MHSVQLQAVVPPFKLTADHAAIKFSQAKLTVNPGQSSTITATFTAPAIAARGYPAYSGHIEITSPSETLRVSYLGVLGSVHEQKVLDPFDPSLNVSLPLVELPDGTLQNATANYTFTNGDYPDLVLRYVAPPHPFPVKNENAELTVWCSDCCTVPRRSRSTS